MRAIKLIVDEAVSRGIKVEWIIEPSVYSLTHEGRTEHFFYRYWSKQGLLPFKLCQNKNNFKKMMVKSGLPAAEGEGFLSSEFQAAREYCKKIGWPVVLKPHNESHGRGVCLSISSDESFEKYWKQLENNHTLLLVEKMYFGKEYRIFVTNEKVISALYRIPANVTSDGMHSIQQSIDIKNNDPERNSCLSMDQIVVNDAVLEKLNESGQDLESIPAKGEYIQLRDASNLSLGGDSKDVTNEIHPSVEKIAVAAVNAIPGLKYGGMDFMTEDITVDQSTVKHAIIELNKSPEIDANHYPLYGEPRDVAGAILDMVFPKTKKK